LALGCATPSNPDLERARAAYAEVAASPDTALVASVEVYEAEKTLRRAEQALQEGKSDEEVSHLAYIAERRVAIAQASARERSANARVEELSRERSDVLLTARTREGEQALRRARELERALAELQAQQTARGLVVTLGDVLFDFGEANLKEGAKLNVSRLAHFLVDHPDRAVLIEGFTDSHGDENFNLRLSEARAGSVRDFLVASGVAPDRLVARGYGESHPMVSNNTPAGRQQNRRVEVTILEPNELAAIRSGQAPLPRVASPPPLP
jgi:outer membrane protein OmpA-like peptidoglycan-associated protein